MSFDSGPGPGARPEGRTRRLRRKVLGEPTHIQPTPAGYVLGVLTAMIVSVAWVCAKPVLEYLDPLSFSISQFGLAAVFAFAWLLVSGE